MGLALHEECARVAEQGRHGLQRGVDQLLIAELAKASASGGDQPVQDTVLADVVTGAWAL
jgi:hypothetical protein